LLPLWRNDPVYHQLKESHDTHERGHDLRRDRFRVGGDNRDIRPQRMGARMATAARAGSTGSSNGSRSATGTAGSAAAAMPSAATWSTPAAAATVPTRASASSCDFGSLQPLRRARNGRVPEDPVADGALRTRPQRPSAAEEVARAAVGATVTTKRKEHHGRPRKSGALQRLSRQQNGGCRRTDARSATDVAGSRFEFGGQPSSARQFGAVDVALLSAGERSRTSKSRSPPGPKPGASASSATPARWLTA
jgi:hypothetical protein